MSKDKESKLQLENDLVERLKQHIEKTSKASKRRMDLYCNLQEAASDFCDTDRATLLKVAKMFLEIDEACMKKTWSSHICASYATQTLLDLIALVDDAAGGNVKIQDSQDPFK